MIPKKVREVVYEKCGGHCAYCGCEITIKQMQVDHIQPHWHTLTEQEASKSKIKKGSHDIDNLNPSCARCNKWKSTYTLEQFRNVIETSLDRLERDTPNFRLARDYNLLTVTEKPIIFYFETLTPKEEMKKNLKSLDDHNTTARAWNATLYGNTPVPNGIACPKCGEELMDSQPMMTLTSNPPQKSIHCSSCDYVGYRIA